MDSQDKYPQFRIKDCRESITAIGVVWPVEEISGRCGCGAAEMASEIAFFVDRSDAEDFVKSKMASAHA